MRTVSQLACPARVEQLARTAQAADGRSCTYAGPQAERIDLTLAPLDGAPAAARLASLDAALQAELPGVTGAGRPTGVYVGGDDSGEDAHVDLPGFHLHASGDRASIRMPGMNIDTDGGGARLKTGLAHGAVVNAHDGGAEIRTGGAGPDGVSTTYLLASNTPGPSGDRAVGYVAKGPAAGPLVIATFHMPGGHHHDQESQGGLDRLVDLNVHG